MRIQFKKGDPRAGMVVEIEGNLGKKHIADGVADEVSGSTPGAPASPSIEHRAIVRAAKNPSTPKRQRPQSPAAKKAAAKKAK